MLLERVVRVVKENQLRSPLSLTLSSHLTVMQDVVSQFITFVLKKSPLMALCMYYFNSFPVLLNIYHMPPEVNAIYHHYHFLAITSNSHRISHNTKRFSFAIPPISPH